ncbi:hypothetical protein TDB9533_02613 [Thalassocella blandensis]|nr:hypothetical protein TDB9533_02613 [Thalassocella blandensis]
MKNKPAKFLLSNSKGYPDFVMTMLVAVILCLFIVLLYWMMLNLIGLYLLTQPTANPEVVQSVSVLLANFNENSQIIIIGICSSVFSLAGTYYLRRSAYDNHYVEKKKLDTQVTTQIHNRNVGLAESTSSSIGHPHFDDEEEDI